MSWKTSEPAVAGPTPVGVEPRRSNSAWRRGLQGSLAMLGLPFRRFLCGPLDRYCCPQRDPAGRIYILPGIEGRSPLNGNVVNGLLDAGLPHSLCVVDWTSRRLFSTLGQLSDIQRHREQAGALAESIVRYRQEHPSAPVHLIGHSGGTGITAFAVAMLPQDVSVDTVCLLASALSPTFDLAPTLSRCRRLINFYSPLDLFFCGVGTLLLGSMDRRRTISAGAVGFRAPRVSMKVGDRCMTTVCGNGVFPPR